MNTKWNWTIFHHSPAAAWSLIAICSVLAACNGGGDGRTKCTSVIGVECNDTLASTISDVFTDTECTCAGTACPTGTTCDDGDPTTTTDVYVLVNDTCSCHGTEPAAPPTIPIAGENTSVAWNGDMGVLNQPAIYASWSSSAHTMYSYILIAVGHDVNVKYIESGTNPSTSGDTLIYTFTTSTCVCAKAVTVFKYANVTSNKPFVKARVSGGGGTVVATANADEEGPIASGSVGIPLLWSRHNGAGTIESGGFIYGLNKKRPTLDDPITGVTPANWHNRITTATSLVNVEDYQCVKQDWPDANGTTKEVYKTMFKTTTVSKRTVWYLE